MLPIPWHHLLDYLETLKMGYTSSPETLVPDQTMTPGKKPKNSCTKRKQRRKPSIAYSWGPVSFSRRTSSQLVYLLNHTVILFSCYLFVYTVCLILADKFASCMVLVRYRCLTTMRVKRTAFCFQVMQSRRNTPAPRSQLLPAPTFGTFCLENEGKSVSQRRW